MAINTDIANTTPDSDWGIVSKGTLAGLGELRFAPDTFPDLTIGCDTSPEECCFKHTVVADASSSDELLNDKTAFVQLSLGITPLVTFTIQKDQVDLFTITDNTYGTFQAIGTLPLGNYSTFELNWRSVLNDGSGGIGCYRIKIEYDLFGITTTIFSETYILKNYSAEAVENTTKFKWTQNGKILNSVLDFTDFEFTQYIRVPGFFGRNEPVYEQTNIVQADRTQQQVQDRITDSFTFESGTINSFLQKIIVYDMCLANDIEVTDYNFYNTNQEIKNLKIRPLDFDNFVYFSRSRITALKIKFGNRREDTIKRNNF